jgi:hypothetical protein
VQSDPDMHRDTMTHDTTVHDNTVRTDTTVHKETTVQPNNNTTNGPERHDNPTARTE